VTEWHVTFENGLGCSFISGDRYKVGGEGERDSEEFDNCGEHEIDGDLEDSNGVGEDNAGGVGVRGTSTDNPL
jgi:hypothetical protein